jgi:hypothetical protein
MLQTLKAQTTGAGLRPATPTTTGSKHEALSLYHFLALLAIVLYF